LARMDARQPLQMSETEIALWDRVRREDRASELARANDRDEQLRKIWE
jgi:hypothetical protein